MTEKECLTAARKLFGRSAKVAKIVLGIVEITRGKDALGHGFTYEEALDDARAQMRESGDAAACTARKMLNFVKEPGKRFKYEMLVVGTQRSRCMRLQHMSKALSESNLEFLRQTVAEAIRNRQP